MKPPRLPVPVLTSALAGLICLANVASAQIAVKPVAGDAGLETRIPGRPPAGKFASNLNVVPTDITHFLSLILGGVGMLHLLRRRSRARLI